MSSLLCRSRRRTPLFVLLFSYSTSSKRNRFNDSSNQKIEQYHKHTLFEKVCYLDYSIALAGLQYPQAVILSDPERSRRGVEGSVSQKRILRLRCAPLRMTNAKPPADISAGGIYYAYDQLVGFISLGDAVKYPGEQGASHPQVIAKISVTCYYRDCCRCDANDL